MIRAELRGMLVRRLRLALTALAVALGVTLIAGTYVFTDTINTAFDRIFASSYARTDAVVTARHDEKLGQDQTASMPAGLLAQVRETPGISDAEGTIFAQGAVVLRKDGKRLSSGGAPTFVVSLHSRKRFADYTFAAGRAPASADEVALDMFSADRAGFHVGDLIAVQAVAPKKRYRLVGITKLAGVDSFGGASLVMFTLPEAQRVTGQVGRLNEIDASARRGIAPEEAARRLSRSLGPGVTVRTGRAQASDLSSQIRDNLGFLRTALLAFAGISLFVGAFIIFNTFSITVAQRAREFALLRTLGAHRRQVMGAVLGEGVVLGAVGAGAGLGLGILLAKGLRALFKAAGIDLPSQGTVVETRTVVVSLLVGLVVTLLSTLMPALRATRVPPVAALREGAVLPRGRGARFAGPIAAAVVVAGVGLLAGGLFGGAPSSTALSLTGAGALALFLGVALLSPRLVPPLAGAIGRPLELLRGITGRLARENAMRQPGRTAATAAALMVGVALVGFASIFAASARTTIHDAVTGGSRAQAILENTNGFGAFSPLAAQAVARVPGVEQVSALRFTGGRALGAKLNVVGIDPRGFAALYHVKAGQAALRALRPGAAVASKKFADAHHVRVGEVVQVRTPVETVEPLRISGIVEDDGRLTGDLTVATAVVERGFGASQDAIVLVGFAPGANEHAVRARIAALLKARFPQVEALSNDQFVNRQVQQVDQLLYLIYALLALAVIVSLFGIVNTLVLSITERTRELGMLRAVGTSRRQVRRMIRYEALITALIGGVLGVVLGIVLATLVSRVIDGFRLTVDPGTMLLLLVLSGLAGVGAAVLPARRASRLDVLEALAYE